jgi:hypothetical protein
VKRFIPGGSSEPYNAKFATEEGAIATAIKTRHKIKLGKVEGINSIM